MFLISCEWEIFRYVQMSAIGTSTKKQSLKSQENLKINKHTL